MIEYVFRTCVIVYAYAMYKSDWISCVCVCDVCVCVLASVRPKEEGWQQYKVVAPAIA